MDAATIAEQPRIDEREVVAGTTARFIQLVALLVVSSGSMMSSYLNLPSSSDGFGGLGCLLAAGVNVNNGAAPATFVPTILHRSAYDACTARYEATPPGWINVVWPLGVILLAALLAVMLPRLTRRRRHLVALATVDPDGRLREAVHDAAREVGLVAVPEIVVDPFSRDTGAMVFGLDSHPVLSLGTDLIAGFEQDRARFDAVVLHELAHIGNRDLTVTTATLAVWRVYLAFVALPSLGLFTWEIVSGSLSTNPFWAGEAPTVIRSLLFPLLLSALAFFVRADVLRAREVYADLSARRWGASGHAWEHHQDPNKSTRRASRLFAALRDASGFHPSWTLRRRALVRPDALFRISPLQMFLAGAATIAISAGGGVYLQSRSSAGSGTWSELATSVLAAAAAVAVAGVALWRAVAYALLNKRSDVPSGITAGLWFGAGMVVANWASGQSADIFQFLPSRPWLELITLLGGVALCWWTATCARLWFAAWPGRDKRPAFVIMLAAMGFLVAAWLDWWSGEATSYAAGLQTPRITASIIELDFPGTVSAHRGLLHALSVLAPIWSNANTPWMTIAVGLLWTVPLIAALLLAVRVRRRPPIIAVAVGAILAIAGIAVAKWRIHAGYPAPDRYTALFLTMTGSWFCVAIVVAATAAALVAALRVPRYRLPAALIASAGTVVIGTTVTFFEESAEGCMRPLADTMHTCVWTPAPGWEIAKVLFQAALNFSTLTAFAAALVVTVATRARAREPQPAAADALDQPTAPAWRRTRSSSVIATSAFVLTALVAVAVTAVPTSDALQAWSNGASPQELNAELAYADVSADQPGRVRTVEIKAWAKLGGAQLGEQWGNEEQRLGDDLNQAVETSPGTLDAQWVAKLRADCVSLGQTAQAAEAYLPIPDPVSEQGWSRALSEGAQASGDCVKALDQENGQALVASVDGLTAAEKQLSTTYQNMTAELQAYGPSGAT